MTEKLIIKWLHIMLAEYNNKICKTTEEIVILNHQIQHYNILREEEKEKVRESLFNVMKEFGWKSSIRELKRELKECRDGKNHEGGENGKSRI